MIERVSRELLPAFLSSSSLRELQVVLGCVVMELLRRDLREASDHVAAAIGSLELCRLNLLASTAPAKPPASA